MDLKYSISNEYKYKARPDDYFLGIVLKEYGLESLGHVPNELQLTGSCKDKQRDEAKSKLRDLIYDEYRRVEAMLHSIPLNTTVEIDQYVNIMRVPSGIIYIFNTYKDHHSTIIVHKATQFIKL